MKKIKPYTASIILAILLLVVSPLGIFIIFMSGDSCCGEDTRGTMAVVTAIIIGILFVFTLVVQGTIAFIQHQRGHEYPFITGVIVTWFLSVTFYTSFFLFIALTAF